MASAGCKREIEQQQRDFDVNNRCVPEKASLREEMPFSVSKIPQFLFFFYVTVVSLNLFQLFFPGRCEDRNVGERKKHTCVFPSVTLDADFRVHAYVSETKNERKVMEEIISRRNRRRREEEERENEDSDEAEEDRRAFMAEFNGGEKKREARRVASANARWGAKHVVENITIPLREFNVRERNGTMLFAHVFMTKIGDEDESDGYEDEAPLRNERDVIWWESVNVLKYARVGERRKTQKLIGGEDSIKSSGNNSSGGENSTTTSTGASGNGNNSVAKNNSASTTILPHLRPHLRVLKVKSPFPFFAHGAPMDIGLRMLNYETRSYRPLAMMDDISISKREWRQLKMIDARTDSSEEDEDEDAYPDDPVISLLIQPLPLGVYRMLRNVETTLDQLQSTMGFTDDDLDEVREMVVGQDWRWLVATFIVSIMHSWFSFLAFKNDVGFWKGRTNVEGLSVRSQWSNFICSTIIFLNIWESRGTASSIIVVETGIAALLELWKCWKFVAAKRARKKNNEEASEMQKDTDEADAKAMKWLVFAVFPCVVGLSIRSLLYHEHRSWKAWFLRNAANGVYIFGFVAMTPQLYINYKLKSVAHLPWRAFMYKTFNTFIDDVFSFAVAMPWQHRIACLRDDVIFFGYLWQRWIYGVDKSRVNEFGRAYDDDNKDDDEGKEKEENEDEKETKKDK